MDALIFRHTKTLCANIVQPFQLILVKSSQSKYCTVSPTIREPPWRHTDICPQLKVKPQIAIRNECKSSKWIISQKTCSCRSIDTKRLSTINSLMRFFVRGGVFSSPFDHELPSRQKKKISKERSLPKPLVGRWLGQWAADTPRRMIGPRRRRERRVNNALVTHGIVHGPGGKHQPTRQPHQWIAVDATEPAENVIKRWYLRVMWPTQNGGPLWKK